MTHLPLPLTFMSMVHSPAHVHAGKCAHELHGKTAPPKAKF